MTYGHGDVQHSAETPFQREQLHDFLGSLGAHIAKADAHERDEMLAIVARHWPRAQNGHDAIRFALSLKPHATKRIYYNLRDQKTSHSASKYHDKRWEAIDPGADHVDGSIVSAARILNVGQCYDDLHAIEAYREIEEVYAATMTRSSYLFCVWDHFKLTADGRGRHSWIEQAWCAVSEMIEAYRTMRDGIDHAQRWAMQATEPAKELAS